MVQPLEPIRPAVRLRISRSALLPVVGAAAFFAICSVGIGAPVAVSAVFGGLGAAVSLLFHELGHVRAARGVQSVRPVAVSFIWAGAATTFEGSYRTGRDQARVAIGGPQASFTFALSLVGVSVLPVPLVMRQLLLLLALFNLGIGLLNLVPAYPLDGYKIVAGLLWSVTGSERKARRILRRVGIGWAALEAPAALILLVERPLVGAIALAVAAAFLAQKRLLPHRPSQASTTR